MKFPKKIIYPVQKNSRPYLLIFLEENRKIEIGDIIIYTGYYLDVSTYTSQLISIDVINNSYIIHEI